MYFLRGFMNASGGPVGLSEWCDWVLGIASGSPVEKSVGWAICRFAARIQALPFLARHLDDARVMHGYFHHAISKPAKRLEHDLLRFWQNRIG
jgi:hypothetical protein